MKNLVLGLSVLCFAPTTFAEDFFKTAQALKQSVLATPSDLTVADDPTIYVRQAYEDGWADRDIPHPNLYEAGIAADVAKIKVLWDPARPGDELIYREIAARLAVLNYINLLPTVDAITLQSLVRVIPPLHRFEDFYVKPTYANSRFRVLSILPRLRLMDQTEQASQKLFETFLKLRPDETQIEFLRIVLDLKPNRAKWLAVKTRAVQACDKFLDRFGIEL